MIDKLKPEVWDALEEVIREHPVLLNRAPTLHRLGIQAFEPVLVDGKAIQLHPLVCKAFNADFDGDQMAVHVPLSATAQAEARILMLSTHNLFSPADGSPVVAPQQDMILGAYVLTLEMPGEPRRDPFSSPEEAQLAYDSGLITLQEPIDVAFRQPDGMKKVQRSTVGRILFSNLLPENMRYVKKTMNKRALGELVAQCHRLNGAERTIQLLDELKALGFQEATKAGMTVAITDMEVPEARDIIIRQAEDEVKKFNRNYQRGLITAGERKERVLEEWQGAARKVGKAILENMGRPGSMNPIFLFTDSGARGTPQQVTQLSGMRGVMSDPFGNMIEDLPVKSNFHEGLSVLEYFVSTHGARKGLADTALRTADAGYLTRRLVDVSQEVIVRAADCGTEQGIYVEEIRDNNEVVEKLGERIYGRYALEDVAYPAGHARAGDLIVAKNDLITQEVAAAIEGAGIRRVLVRSPFTCELHMGICAQCYGLDLANSKLVEPGVAVGIIAAQSIGEPGTQLTMRTFHSGGIAQKQLVGVANVRQRKQEALKELHTDISRGIVSLETDGESGTVSTAGADRERVRAVQAVLKVLEDQVGGLLRVVELFEARKPKGQAIVTEYSGVVAEIEQKGLRRVIIHTEVPIEETSTSGLVGESLAEDIYLGPHADTEGMTAAAARRATEIPETLKAGTDLTEKHIKKMREVGIQQVKIRKASLVPYRGQLQVAAGKRVEAGDRLTEGPLDPQKVLELQGIRGVQNYIVREIQAVYKSQGVDINDKHIEVIARQMLRRRKIKNAGDSDFLPGQVVDKFEFEEANRAVREMDPPGTEATADWLLLGITEASLATDSFLSAASFQKTTRVLTEAAVRGKKDSLVGLKENVIIGRLIPAGTGLPQYRNIEPKLEGIDSANRLASVRAAARAGGAVLDRETRLDDEDLAVIREATGTSGDSLSLLAEREMANGNGELTNGTIDEPTIDIDGDGAI
jgi:DNA-directed RNA polymerase subunit beta'